MKEQIVNRFENGLEKPLFKSNFSKICVIVSLGLIVHFLIYFTGGTNTSLPQLNIPIILLASYYWGLKGGIITAIALGIATGPFMPLVVNLQIMQKPVNYIVRLLFYIFVAGFSYYLFKKIEKITQELIERETINEFTGLYNTKMFLSRLESLIDNNEEFQIMFLKITSLEEISKYIDYYVVEAVIEKFVLDMKAYFPDTLKYSSNFNEFIIIFNHRDKKAVLHTISAFLQSYENGIQIEEYNLELVIKAGLVNEYEKHEKPVNVMNRVRIAADQGRDHETSIYVYNYEFEKLKKYEIEVAHSIKAAIENEEFYLVYQPIVDIQRERIAGAEVLMRWERGNKEPIFPDVFIDIAEKVGLIKEISKFLIKKNLNQTGTWSKAGFDIKTSINLTINELLDGEFLQWGYEIVQESGIDRIDMGIELTERTILKDQEKSRIILSDLQARGYKIYIDDFGTGYNSIMNMTVLPYDVIKIDKIFIDVIEQEGIKSLVRHIIEAVHEGGKVVVAEGVETKAQYDILKEIGCDKIQGYYFSKPLLPDEFIKYYSNFDIDVYKMTSADQN